MQKSTSFMLAAATAALFAGGLAATSTVHADEATVHCAGINSCKGMSDCKTAQNACKGQNVCKGHGFKAVTKSECDAKGGKVIQ